MKARGSVPNVVRARKEGAAGRASRSAKLNQLRKGTVGSTLNDNTAKVFRGGKRRNS